jgi:hypothetical protein
LANLRRASGTSLGILALQEQGREDRKKTKHENFENNKNRSKAKKRKARGLTDIHQ